MLLLRGAVEQPASKRASKATTPPADEARETYESLWSTTDDIATRLQALGDLLRIESLWTVSDKDEWNKLSAWMQSIEHPPSGTCSGRLRAAYQDLVRNCGLIARQLAETSAVQELLVPRHGEITHEKLTVVGHYMPADASGGDWWRIEPLHDRRTIIAIGDVTGHGTAATMITAVARSAFDTALHLSADRLTPTLILQLLHESLRRVAKGHRHMTCSIALIDSATGDVNLASAGHCFPYLLSPNASPHLRPVLARGDTLGGVNERPSFQSMQFRLEPGQRIVWYTDGLSECRNDEGQEFGDRRVRRVLKWAMNRDPVAIQEAIFSAMSVHRGLAPLSDDVTLVVAGLS
jgi:phosphoserine phosphatase RsbU/P